MTYQDLIHIRECYNEALQTTIKDNIKRLMKEHKVKHDQLVKLLSISSHTAYSYTNKANNNKPELYNLLILSYYFNVSIYEILE